MTWQILHGDCIEVMASLPAASVDAIVTDPPYGLGFMGRAWDDLPPGLLWAQECLRVLKPGGHLLAFGGTRTYHRLTCAIEDAGFEVRDCIAWMYGSGFPKSLNVSAAIDKAAGATREVTGRTATPFKVDAAGARGTSLQGSVNGDFSKQVDEDGYRYTEHTAPATPEAEQWQGWGTALKPAFEPVVVARKPLNGTVVNNILTTGGVWVELPDGGSGAGIRHAKVCYDCRDALSGLRNGDAGLGVATQEGEAPADVWSGVQERDDARGAKSPLDGRSMDRLAGLCDRERAGSGTDAGASSSGRALHGTTPATGRDGASSRREQDQQSPVEPRGEGEQGGPRPASRAERCARCDRGLYGTGALNVDGCRIGTTTRTNASAPRHERNGFIKGFVEGTDTIEHDHGRWPANVVLDPEAAAVLDEQTGELTSNSGTAFTRNADGNGRAAFGTFDGNEAAGFYGDTGGASRFFYVPKADSAERNAGLSITTLFTPPDAPTRNDHPTVKPIALMRWLVRLVTPPGGLVIDPFAGSGTTGCAAVLEGFDFIGIEREEASVGIARARIAHWSNGTTEDAA